LWAGVAQGAPWEPIVHRASTRAAVAGLLIAACGAGIGGCGDDFPRAESTPYDIASHDIAAHDIVPTDVVSTDAPAADADAPVDAGSPDTQITDAAPVDTAAPPRFPGLGAPCQTPADCGAEAPGVCLAWSCAAGHCAITQREGTCGDGDKCNAPPTCRHGQCAAGPNLCPCGAAADCADDDADKCNGTRYCDTAADKPGCKLNPATVVYCSTKDDTACVANTCDPATGQCLHVPAEDGTACADDSACTVGDACEAGKCAPGTDQCACMVDADCADDGDLCNGVMYCDNGVFPFVCAVNPATVVVCPTTDDTACAVNTCDGKTGTCAMVAQPEGKGCDDGDKCTATDTCKAGKCAPGENTCACKTDADCKGREDGDLCNGTLYCATAGAEPVCVVNAKTIVHCSAEDDTQCMRNTCDPATAKCGPTALADGATCTDDNVCTTGDACKDGTCAASANQCACKLDADCAAHDDMDLCDGSLYCDTSKAPFQCVINPKTVVQCTGAQDDQCRLEVCTPATGKCALKPRKDGTSCDADGNPCTPADRCLHGACLAGENVCGCQQDADCKAKEDGDVCNGTLVCAGTGADRRCLVNPKTEVVCDATGDTACAMNLCDPKTGKCALADLPDGVTCNADNDACTGPDTCKAGTCTVGKTACQCTADADCSANDGDNKCLGTSYCDKKALPFVCRKDPGTVITSCPPAAKACEVSLCDPGQGKCVNKPATAGHPCDDGDACSVQDACDKGACAGGPNMCLCQVDADCLPFDNGNPCDGKYACQQGRCALVGKPVCPAEAATCTTSVCDPTTGQCHEVADQDQEGDLCPHKDGVNHCRGPARCAYGVCTRGGKTECPDGTACIKALPCEPSKGCVSVELSKAVTCDDDSACTSADHCDQGDCVGTEGACDDGNACTIDACGKDGKTCTASPGPPGEPCEDGDKCTLKDTCKSTTCTAGKALECTNGTVCAPTACDPGTGKCDVKSKACDDDNVCTTDSCAAEGCEHRAGADGSACGGGKFTCQAGNCGAGCGLWRNQYASPYSGSATEFEAVVAFRIKGKTSWVGTGAGNKSGGVNWTCAVDPAGGGKVATLTNWGKTYGAERWYGAAAAGDALMLVGETQGSAPGAPYKQHKAWAQRTQHQGGNLRKTSGAVIVIGNDLVSPRAVVTTADATELWAILGHATPKSPSKPKYAVVRTYKAWFSDRKDATLKSEGDAGFLAGAALGSGFVAAGYATPSKSKGTRHGLVVRFSSVTAQWQRQVLVLAGTTFEAATADKKGAITVAGRVFNSASKSQTRWPIVQRLRASDGKLGWQVQLDNEMNGSAYGIATYADAGVLVAGSSPVSGGATRKAFMVRLDKDGKVRWHRRYPDSQNRSTELRDVMLSGDVALAVGQLDRDGKARSMMLKVDGDGLEHCGAP